MNVLGECIGDTACWQDHLHRVHIFCLSDTLLPVDSCVTPYSDCVSCKKHIKLTIGSGYRGPNDIPEATATFQNQPQHSTSHRNIPQTTGTFHKLPQHSTSYRNIPQATRTLHKLPEHSTSYRSIPQATGTFHKLPGLPWSSMVHRSISGLIWAVLGRAGLG